MERVAIFPGSFDPFTRGHEAIVEEALHLFDRVVIAIGHNIAKRGFLPSAERKRLIEELYAADPRVEVTLFTTLMGEEARRVGLGLNAGHDLNTENLQYFIERIPWVDEVSIGHALISDALYWGLENTVEIYQRCIRRAHNIEK